MRDQGGPDELCSLLVSQPGVYLCRESAAQEEEAEYGGKRRVAGQEEVCRMDFY